MLRRLPAFVDQSAVTSIEYALLGALIATVIFIAVGNAGSALGDLYQYVSGRVSAAVAGSPAGTI